MDIYFFYCIHFVSRLMSNDPSTVQILQKSSDGRPVTVTAKPLLTAINPSRIVVPPSPITPANAKICKLQK